jgi:hypothetical protein
MPSIVASAGNMPRGAIAAFKSRKVQFPAAQNVASLWLRSAIDAFQCRTTRREQGGLSEQTRRRHRERFHDLPVAVEYDRHSVTILDVVHADHDRNYPGPRLSD